MDDFQSWLTPAQRTAGNKSYPGNIGTARRHLMHGRLRPSQECPPLARPSWSSQPEK